MPDNPDILYNAPDNNIIDAFFQEPLPVDSTTSGTVIKKALTFTIILVIIIVLINIIILFFDLFQGRHGKRRNNVLVFSRISYRRLAGNHHYGGSQRNKGRCSPGSQEEYIFFL